MSTAFSLRLSDPRLRSDLARSLRRRVDPADTEDIVQAVLTEALAAEPRLENLGSGPEEEVRRFVFAIARQKVADWYRRRGREARRVLPEPEPTRPLAESSDLLRWAEHALPPAPEARQTLDWMLREGEGETLAEIAAAERVPAPAVRQRVSRLRRHLRAVWSREASVVALLGLLVLGLAFAWRSRSVEVAAPAVDPVPRPSAAPAVTTLPPLPVTPSPVTSPVEALPAAPPASTAPLVRPPPRRAAPPPPPQPAPTAQTTSGFDRGAAAAALGSADVSTCSTAETPAGESHAMVTFGTDGKPVTVVIDSGPLAGRPEAACVAARLRGVSVPPFAGANVRVGKSFRHGL